MGSECSILHFSKNNCVASSAKSARIFVRQKLRVIDAIDCKNGNRSRNPLCTFAEIPGYSILFQEGRASFGRPMVDWSVWMCGAQPWVVSPGEVLWPPCCQGSRSVSGECLITLPENPEVYGNYMTDSRGPIATLVVLAQFPRKVEWEYDMAG